ncbi:MAG: hypothetical protein ACRCS9_16555 [Hyphomicrobium sp.]
MIGKSLTRTMLAMGSLSIASFASAQAASAQALTPMRGEIKSFTDQFAVRVFPANPYERRIRIEVKVYDETFAPVPAIVSPPDLTLGPQDNRSVVVMVPFDGAAQRRVRICAESIPFEDKSTRLRTQVCGRFLGHRVR